MGPGGRQQGKGPAGLEAGLELPWDLAKAVQATATELWLPYRASWFRPKWLKQMPSASTGAHLHVLLHSITPAELKWFTLAWVSLDSNYHALWMLTTLIVHIPMQWCENPHQ